MATLAVVLGAFGLIVPGGPARADDAGCADPTATQVYVCVTFASDVHDPVLISRAELFDPVTDMCARCDVDSNDYTTYGAGPYGPVVGLSMKALISYAAGPGSFPQTTFTQTSVSTDTYQSLLDNSAGTHEISSPPFRGLPAAVYFSTNTRNPNAGYIRPQRSATDNNARDAFETGGGHYLHVVVHTEGRVLHPAVSVERPPLSSKGTYQVKAGVPVPLDVTVPDGSGTTLSYRWDFHGGTGAPTTQPSVSPSYGAAVGAAYPSVVVIGSDTSYGTADLANPITVGSTPAPDPTTSAPGGGTGPRTAPAGGPKTGNGTRSGGAGTPAPGGGLGPGTGTGTPAPTGSGGAGSAPSGAPTPRRGASATPTPGRTADAADRAGTLVSGQLLIAPRAELPAAGPSVSAGQAAAASARRPGRSGLDLQVLWGLVPIALLVLGVFTERRRPRARGSAP